MNNYKENLKLKAKTLTNQDIDCNNVAYKIGNRLQLTENKYFNNSTDYQQELNPSSKPQDVIDIKYNQRMCLLINQRIIKDK